MATKKGSKKKAEEVVEEVVEETPVVEEPAPKETKKATPKKKELPEHVGYKGTPEDYTKEVHLVLLDREPSERELEYYAGLVTKHGLPLTDIVHQLKKSGEYQGKHGTYL